MMTNPFMNMKNLMGMFQQFRENPMQFMMKNRLNIPQQYANDPDKAIQYLMDSGTMTQQQYNQIQQMVGQIQNTSQSPMNTQPRGL